MNDQPVQELLTDPLTGDRVILAPSRAARPATYPAGAEPLPPKVADCPFCPGNEHSTPPEVYRIGPGAADTPGWRVRVVPNKFPLVGNGVAGAHEVVIFSPAHDASYGALTDDAAAEVLVAMRDRSRFHLAHGLVHAQAFVNSGKAAGGSLEHPHGQLVALGFVPPRVLTRLELFTAEGLAADHSDPRHVVQDDSAIVWCPPASPSPYAARCTLPGVGAHFDEADDDQLRVVACALRDLVRRLHAVCGPVPYNLVVQTAPRGHRGAFQWWVDMIPRTTVIAGFEMGTGVLVNTVAPADAAGAFRELPGPEPT